MLGEGDGAVNGPDTADATSRRGRLSRTAPSSRQPRSTRRRSAPVRSKEVEHVTAAAAKSTAAGRLSPYVSATVRFLASASSPVAGLPRCRRGRRRGGHGRVHGVVPAGARRHRRALGRHSLRERVLARPAPRGAGSWAARRVRVMRLGQVVAPARCGAVGG
jgi:hypothetical protein